MNPMPATAPVLTGVGPLTIRRVDAIPLALPLKHVVAMSGVSVTHGETLVMRVEAANGLVGWGEASADADWHFLEQPFGKKELGKAAELARLTKIPLCADEGIGSVTDVVAYHRAGAATGAALKSIKLGSVTETVRAATVCEALGFSINLSEKMAESSIGGACLIHLGAVLAQTRWGVCPSNHYLAEDIVTRPIQAVGGMLTLPPGPGLGVEVDARALERYRV